MFSGVTDFLNWVDKEAATRLKNGYLQFFDLKRGEWEWVHREVARRKIGGEIPKGYEDYYDDY